MVSRNAGAVMFHVGLPLPRMGREKRSCDGMAEEGRASLAGRGRAHEDGRRWWTVERRFWYVAGVVGVFSGSTRREPCGGGGIGASCAAGRRDGGEGWRCSA